MFIEVRDIETLFHVPEPWYIDSCVFDQEQKQLDVYVKFRKRAQFPCAHCGAPYQRVYDVADYDRTWRHLNFLEHPCYIHAEMPRTQCDQCGHIRRVDVPWAIKARSSFTMMFDAYILTLAKDMPMNAVSRLVNEEDKKLWRVLHYYVDHAVAVLDLSHVTKISTDETSAKRGHNYITVFMDSEQKNVICVTKGKDASTWETCKKHLEEHGGDAQKVEEVCIDMSPAFIKGAKEQFPGAEITFDKFHVIQLMNQAVDEVRRMERKSCAELINTRYIWLENPENLTKAQRETLDKLKDCELDTAKAYQMKLCLQEIYRYPDSIAPLVLEDWIQWGLRCRLEPIVQVAKTLQRHYNGVIRWFTSKLNNGLLEGVNSLFQAAKRKARGYRTGKNIIAMVYLLAGKLNFALKH